MRRCVRLFAMMVFSLLTTALIVSPASAQNAQLAADVQRLSACIDAAYPEGEAMPVPGQKPPQRPRPGACSGLVVAACGGGATCDARESRAWLHLARQSGANEWAKKNAKYHAPVVAGLQRQAVAICTAAASASAWGNDQVPKGQYKPTLDTPCVREAIAGMAIPLLGNARGM